MLLQQVVGIKVHWSFLEKLYFNYRIRMIKAKQGFFGTCNSRGYGFHGNKAAIL